MGIGGISGWQLLILLLIVVLVFGTKRLRNMGSDLGSAVRGFKKGLNEDEEQEPEQLGVEAMPSSSAEQKTPESQTSKD